MTTSKHRLRLRKGSIRQDRDLWRGLSDIMTDNLRVAIMAEIPFISLPTIPYKELVRNGVSGHLMIKVVAS